MVTEQVELARRDDPELNRLARLGSWLAAAESGRDDPTTKGAAAALRLYYAEALQLPPLAALELSVIKGRVVPSAALLRALADQAGLRVIRTEESATSCTAAVVEVATGRIVGQTTFTLEQAKQAGLVRPNGSWQTYPERMLWARASSYAVRDYAPKVALGLTFADEVEEITGTPAPFEPQPYDLDGSVLEDEDIEFGVDPTPTPTPATERDRMRIGELKAAITQLEQQAGLDQTDWDAWVEREGRTVSGSPLTHERAQHVIRELEGNANRLAELTRP